MTPTLREALAQTYADTCLYASLHDGDPGSTGANEIASTPRVAITWNSGSVDGQVVSDPVLFDIAAEVIATHVGIWSDAVGGTFLDSVLNGAPLSPGDYAVTLNYTQN